MILMEEDINKWKDSLCSWIVRINIVKMSTLYKTIYRIQAIYQNSNDIFHRNRRNNSQICMGPQKTLNSQRNFEKEQQSWRYHVPNFIL